MTMRVLLATDGSENAASAARRLTSFPLPPSSELCVLAVAVYPLAAPELALSTDLQRAIADAAHRAADEARETFVHRWPRTTAQIVDGEPREAIARVAREWSADLVVVGARGLGTVSRFLLGSVSTSVVHSAPCHVLVVKERSRELRSVVVAVDGSPGSVDAVRFLAGLPLDPALRIRLLGVVERVRASTGGPEAMGPAIQRALDEVLAERRATLDAALASCAKELGGKVSAIERQIVVGHPADAIVAAANEPGTDLVVVGTRGLGLVGRVVLGSVSERVLHHAECSVLIVKGHPTP